MAIVIPDLSGIGQGITTAGGALAGALEKRAEKRLLGEQREAKKRALERANLSTQKGQQEFIQSYIDAGGDIKEALATVKQFQPSTLEGILSQYGYGTPTQAQAPAQQQGFGTPYIPTLPGQAPVFGQQPLEPGMAPSMGQIPSQAPTGVLDSVVPSAEDHPATRGTPFSNIPSEVAAALTASSNPAERDLGKAILDIKDNAHKRYNEDRKYASSQSKRFTDNITDERNSFFEKKATRADLEYGLLNREPGTELADWVADRFGTIGERFISPEGNLISTAVKNFLIKDLESVKGRPNQYIEQRIVSSLPGLTKSRAANMAIAESMRMREELSEAKIDMYDKLAAQYSDPKVLGYIPENIESLVYEGLKPVYTEIENRHAYKLRQLQEGAEGVESLAKKKVIQGTPLTIEMMTYLVDEVGADKARARAKTLGYRIPTIDEYKRYNQ